MSGMSYREKSAWVSFVTTLLIWGYFTIVFVREIASRNPDGGRLMGTFVGCTILIVILQILSAIVLALLHPRDYDARADERERLIDLKASRMGFVTLSTLAMFTILTVPVLAVGAPAFFPNDPVSGPLSVVGGGVFLAIVLSELVHTGWQILLFRRSA